MKLLSQSFTETPKFIFKLEGKEFGVDGTGTNVSAVFDVAHDAEERVKALTKEKLEYAQQVALYLAQNISKIEMKNGEEMEEGMKEKLRDSMVAGLETQDFGSGNDGWMKYLIESFAVQNCLEITFENNK